ncbi:hypothetical protein [Natronococcus wangiae]|uniref:hypothetical protein n=1 Tax=Natronococcus wangiae TaxID=3068275 RepID=UPI00273E97DB|nr:hypothetical protein [Natronococcus sp. AD5]
MALNSLSASETIHCTSLHTARDALEIDGENARLAAVGLAIRLVITAAVVGPLLRFGGTLSGIFV